MRPDVLDGSEGHIQKQTEPLTLTQPGSVAGVCSQPNFSTSQVDGLDKRLMLPHSSEPSPFISPPKSPPPQLEHRPSSSLDQASGCTGPISWSIPFWRSLLCDVIHPRSRFRHVWDLLMSLILISWVSIILPYIVCFDIPCDLPSALGIIEIFVDVIFIFDVWFNFRTGFYDEDKWGKPVTDMRVIAWQYTRTWMSTDIISCVPWNLVESSVSHNQDSHISAQQSKLVKLLSLVCLVKILKLIRILRTPDFVAKVEKRVGSTFLHVGGSIAAGLLLVHIGACLFYFIALVEGLQSHCWVYVASLADAKNYERYIASLYWTVTTIGTVGYGDITAVTVPERLWAILMICVGATMFAYYLGTIANLVTTANAQASRIAAEKKTIDDFLLARRVPGPLAKRVRGYYAYVLDKQFEQQDMKIISGLSNTLRTDLVLSLHAATVERVPFLRHKHPQFIASVVLAFKLEFYGVDEYIIKQGQVGNEMFFLSEGSLEVRYELDTPSVGKARSKGKKNKTTLLKHLANKAAHQIRNQARPSYDLTEPRYEVIKTMSAGEYFGEYGCLTGEPRSASVVATSFCEIYSLSRQALQDAIQEWPELAEELNLIGEVDGLGGNDITDNINVSSDPSGPAAIRSLSLSRSQAGSAALDIPANWLEAPSMTRPSMTFSACSACPSRPSLDGEPQLHGEPEHHGSPLRGRSRRGMVAFSSASTPGSFSSSPRARVPLYVVPPEHDWSSSGRPRPSSTPRGGGSSVSPSRDEHCADGPAAAATLSGRFPASPDARRLHASLDAPQSFSVPNSALDIPWREDFLELSPQSFTDKCELPLTKSASGQKSANKY